MADKGPNSLPEFVEKVLDGLLDRMKFTSAQMIGLWTFAREQGRSQDYLDGIKDCIQFMETSISQGEANKERVMQQHMNLKQGFELWDSRDTTDPGKN